MDIFVIIIFLLLIGLGFYKGFKRDLLSLLSIICSALASVGLHDTIMFNFFPFVESKIVVSIGVYVAVFIIALIITGLITSYIVKAFMKGGKSFMDRILGAVMGFIKAYVFCLFIYFMMYSITAVTKPDFNDTSNIGKIEQITPDILKNSKTYPIFYGTIVKIDEMFGETKE